MAELAEDTLALVVDDAAASNTADKLIWPLKVKLAADCEIGRDCNLL